MAKAKGKATGTTKMKSPTGTTAPIVHDDDDVVPSNSQLLHRGKSKCIF